MPESNSPHDKLLYYGILCVVGIIIVVVSLPGFLNGGWESALIGAVIAGVGGYEVKITYNRIQIEEGSIKAAQSGTGNIQNNLTNPTGSAAIGSAQNVYIGTHLPSPTPPLQQQEPKKEPMPSAPAKGKEELEKEESDLEELCNGEIHFDKTEVFTTRLHKGDRINFHFTSAQPVSVWIMNEEDYDNFEPDDDDISAYYRSPKSTSFGNSWPAKKREKVFIVVVNQTDLDEWETGEAIVTITINAERKKRKAA